MRRQASIKPKIAARRITRIQQSEKTNTKQVTKLNNARYTVQAVIKRFDMVGLAQLVRASGCGPEGRGFDPHHSPHEKALAFGKCFFSYICRAASDIAER